MKFLTQKDIVLSLEIKAGALRAALVQIGKAPRILGCESCPLEKGSAEAAEGLRGLLKQAGKRLHSAILVLPREEILLKSLVLSGAGPGGIAKALEERIPQEIPYNAGEVVKDFVVHEKRDHESKVLLAVGHKRVVEEKLKWLEEVPLVPDKIVYSGEVIFQACREKNFRWAGPGGVLLIDVDEEASEVVYANQHQVVYSNKAGAGREAFEAKDPMAFAKLFHEIETLLPGEHGKVKNLAKRIVLSGALPAEKELERKVKEYFWTEPNLLGLEGQESVTFSLTALFGAGAGALSGLVNLQLDEIKKRKLREERVVEANRVLRSAAVFLLGILLFAAAHAAGRKFFLASLEAKIEVLKPRTNTLEETAVGLRMKAQHDKTKFSLLETLAVLHEVTPGSIALKKIDYDFQKGMTVRGTAATNEGVTQYLKKLRKVPKAVNPVLDYSQQKKTKGEGLYDFQIRFGLKGAGE